MPPRKIIFLLLFLLMMGGFAHAQNVSVDILQKGNSFKDSSYYDIIQVDSINYWMVGKYGIISNYNATTNKITPVNYPGNHTDIYKIDKFDGGNIVACADRGNIYFYDNEARTWKSSTVKGFENSCFYNMVIIGKKTALICGGRSAIAHSKKTVPSGFIIKTNDGGKTWTKVFSSLFKMVWAMQYNKNTDSLFALIYLPNHTNLYVSKDKGGSWKCSGRIGKGIYYNLEFDNNNKRLCFGGKINGNGNLKTDSCKTITFQGSGLIWSKTNSGNNQLMTACNGNILFSENAKNWQLIHTALPDRFSLYKAQFINSDKALIVGSGKTVLLFNINQPVSSK